MSEKSGQAEKITDIADKILQIRQPVLKKIVDFFGIDVLILMDQTVAEARHISNRFREIRRKHLRLAELDQNVPVIGYVSDSPVGQNVASEIQNTLDGDEKGMLNRKLSVSVVKEVLERLFLMTAERFQHFANGFNFCADDFSLNHAWREFLGFSGIGQGRIVEYVSEELYFDNDEKH